MAYQDLIGLKNVETGRTGMTGEQVVRAAILKQYRSLSYEELAFHLDDSESFRTLPDGHKIGRCRNGRAHSRLFSASEPVQTIIQA